LIHRLATQLYGYQIHPTFEQCTGVTPSTGLGGPAYGAADYDLDSSLGPFETV